MPSAQNVFVGRSTFQHNTFLSGSVGVEGWGVRRGGGGGCGESFVEASILRTDYAGHVRGN